jgi:hypothetical protein
VRTAAMRFKGEAPLQFETVACMTTAVAAQPRGSGSRTSLDNLVT